MNNKSTLQAFPCTGFCYIYAVSQCYKMEDLIGFFQLEGHTVHTECANKEKAENSFTTTDGAHQPPVLEMQARLWNLALLTFHG